MLIWELFVFHISGGPFGCVCFTAPLLACLQKTFLGVPLKPAAHFQPLLVPQYLSSPAEGAAAPLVVSQSHFMNFNTLYYICFFIQCKV